MKNLSKVFLSSLCIVFFYCQTYSQSDISGLGGHSAFALPYWVGWDIFTTSPLTIAHQSNIQNIQFQLGTPPIPSGLLNYDVPVGGLGNTTFGYNTPTFVAGGFANSYFGVNSGFTTSTGFCNTFMGHSAGFTNGIGYFNSFYGDSAGWSNTIGNQNTYAGHVAGYWHDIENQSTFVGDSAGYGLVGSPFNSPNTFIGASSGINTYGNENTFTGFQAGHENTWGYRNTFNGHQAGYWGGFGYGKQEENVYVGYKAGFGTNILPLSNGHDFNTFIGGESGYPIHAGSLNSCLGYQSGFSINDGGDNTFIGEEAGFTTTDGYGNTFTGGKSGLSNTGSYNAFYGISAGEYHGGGLNDYNTYIGSYAQYPGTTHQYSLIHSIALGANAIVNDDYQMELGENGVKVGIGLSMEKHPPGVGPYLPPYATWGGPRDVLEINLGLYSDYPGDFTAVPPIGDPNFYSGLQFRDLNAYNTPRVDNPSCKVGPSGCAVLSVDETGRVILVQESGGGNGIGFGPCTTGATSLTDDVGLQLNEWNVYYSVPGAPLTQNNSVGIGYNCYDPLLARLDVINKTYTLPLVFNYTDQYAGKFYQTGTEDLSNGLDDMVGVYAKSDVSRTGESDFGNNLGGDFYATNVGLSGNNIGVRATANGSYNNANYGIMGYALNSWVGYGVYAQASCSNTNQGVTGLAFAGSSTNTGVFGSGKQGLHAIGGNFNGSSALLTNTGVQGRADGLNVAGAVDIGVLGTAVNAFTPLATHYAVYGDLGVPACPGFPPVPCPTGADYAGYFNGDVISLTNFFQLSDSSLKTNIHDLTNPMAVLSQIHPKTYSYSAAQTQSMMLSDGTHAGMLAQDVENVLPVLVKNSIHPARYDSLGNQTYPSVNFKALNYIEFIPYLIAAVKQQDSTIQALQDQIDNCCNNGGNRAPKNNGNGGDGGNNRDNENIVNTHTIDLSSLNSSPMLYQNQPNPFNNGGTKIKYFIPGNINNAQISFFDEYGNAMTVFNITDKGMGELIVTSENLASGVYSYSLVIDNKVIDTKRMMKIK